MQPLKKVVGDARIVALGEATHGTRSVGALFDESPTSRLLAELTAPSCFDAMLFVEKSTAARNNP